MNSQVKQVEIPSVGGISADMSRLAESARDALSDDIVARLASTLGDAVDLLDRLNRSGVAQALPTISAMVSNGDLDRLAHLARLVGSAQDAVTDDIVGRVASVATDVHNAPISCGSGALHAAMDAAVAVDVPHPPKRGGN